MSKSLLVPWRTLGQTTFFVSVGPEVCHEKSLLGHLLPSHLLNEGFTLNSSRLSDAVADPGWVG